MLDEKLIQHLEEDEDDSGNDWLVTYADISLLLLVFFVLLFSMSDINPLRFNDSFTSVRQALGEDDRWAQTTQISDDEGILLEDLRMQRQWMEEQKRVFSDIRMYLNTKGLEGIIGAVFDQGVITLRVPSDIMFAQGEVGVSPKGRQAILSLMDVFLQSSDQTINIKGYTDNVPPTADSRFQDNWEISSLRAVNVLRLLLENGIESNRLTATGLADLEPLYPNNSEENRASNRRVEFVLERRVGR